MLDWAAFDRFSEDTVYCRCEQVYRSHAKIDMETRRPVSRKPCPKCGRTDNTWKISTDPESMTVGGGGS